MTIQSAAGEMRSTRPLTGPASIVRHAYEGNSLQQLASTFQARLLEDPMDASAMLDLSTILEVAGQAQHAATLRRSAISLQQSYHLINQHDRGLRLLVLKADGDLMATTPVEFLLEHAAVSIDIFYVDPRKPDLSGVPEHDVAFMAIAECEENRPALMSLVEPLAGWKKPIINSATSRVLALTRTGVAQMFRNQAEVLAPPVARVDHTSLSQSVIDVAEPSTFLPGAEYPLIIRPVGSHAGYGLEKVDNRNQLASYLQARANEQFYVSTFVDYRSPDGLYRKQRIAFIDGVAFPAHMAISDNWMVHYLSAGMADNVTRRCEEAAWMATFDAGFATRHRAALECIWRNVGLDYFAIDCAEMQDGRLLLFEADVAMIIHSLDPASVFPYKISAMQTLFDAFGAMLTSRVQTPA